MNSSRERFYPLTVVLCLLGYASYVLSKAVFFLIAAPTALVLAPFPRAKYRVLQSVIHRSLGFFTRIWLPLLGIYRVREISGIEQARAEQPTILVANHRGFMDGLFILGLVPRTGVLIKARDTRQLFYALLERHFDLVGVDSRSRDSVTASLNRCQRLLGEGKHLLVFPEGTRARTGRLVRFNRVAFDLALATRVPVVPVIIHSTWPFLCRLPGSIFPRGRLDYRIRFLDPETPRPDDDAEALSDRVYRRMASELKALDAGTFWEIGTP
jgi:1-acyl-sn-glycerol-3-phosphate acyltransferase